MSPAITTRIVDGATVATLHDENGNAAFHWVADSCAPEGGMHYGTAPAPLTRRQRIGCWLAGWAPGLLGFGITSGWILLALRAHH